MPKENSPTTPADDFIAPPCLDDIQIVYEDKSLLVIDKPSGLLSLSGKNPASSRLSHRDHGAPFRLWYVWRYGGGIK